MAQSRQILVVDDEPVILEVCRRTLSPENSIVTASSGDEALRIFQSGDYDLVLTDLVMPGSLDGQALLEKIKTRSPGTDVMIMTGHPTLDTAIPTLKHGAIDYLQKPFDQDVLRASVARCLEKRRLSQELDPTRRLRQDLRAAYTQLQEMERLKEAFLARVNHELRSPMTALLMAMHRLRSSSNPEESRTLYQLMEERLHQLQSVIESVLLFSDLKNPNSTCSKQDMNGHKALNEIILSSRTLWSDKNLNIQVTWESGADILRGNPKLIDIAFKCLFSNAIQFNRQNGDIRIQARRTGSTIEISFADTGIGIGKHQRSRLFTGFYQVADYLTREVGGLGLGLALVKRIAELHGGSISVESNPSGGSVFTLILPREEI